MVAPHRKASSIHPVTEAPGRYLKRDEAADLLGVSVQTMLTHEQRGRIVAYWAVTPTQSGQLRNSPLYKIEDVLKLPRKTNHLTSENPDELCARVFEALEEGKSLREIVILLRVGYQRLLELHEQWKDSGGVIMEISDEQRRALESKLGPIASVGHLVELVNKVAP